MRAILLCLLLGVMGLAGAEGGSSTVNVVTQTPIVMGSTRDVTGVLTGLSTKAREAGLGDATLHGTVTYKTASGGAKRAVIHWDSIKWHRGTESTEGGLEKPLLSQFSTKVDRVEPSTTLAAKGDIEALTSSFDNVKKRAIEAARAMGGDAAAQQAAAGESTRAAGNSGVGGGYVPGSGSYDSGSSTGASSDTGSTDGSGVNTETVVTLWEQCAPRIDKAAGKVYRQAKEVKRLGDGTVISEGECVDRGATVPITRDYTGCDANFDFENMAVYEQYKEVADVDGTVLLVSGCTVDTERSIPMESTFDGCSVRHDFIAGHSVQLEQYWYRDATGKTVKVGDCRDSSHTYPHYKTSQTCTDVVDQANGWVIPYQRVAYNLGDGTVQYAAECQAQSTTGIAIQEEVCDPKYEHDWISHVSYLRTQQFYTDLTGQKKIISNCQRSTTVSYVHKFETEGCAITNDDDNLLTRWNATTFIETPDDGDLTIADCAEYANPTPYVYVGNSSANDSSATKTWAEGTKVSGNSMLSGVNTSDPIFECATSGTFYENTMAYNNSSQFNPCTNRSKEGYAGNPAYDAILDWWRWDNDRARRTLTISYMYYLRGDGTTYKKPVKRTYKLDAIE